MLSWQTEHGSSVPQAAGKSLGVLLNTSGPPADLTLRRGRLAKVSRDGGEACG